MLLRLHSVCDTDLEHKPQKVIYKGGRNSSYQYAPRPKQPLARAAESRQGRFRNMLDHRKSCDRVELANLRGDIARE